MTAKVCFAKPALADLEAIRAGYAERGAPDAGARLVSEIVELIERLAAHPDRGHVVPEFGQYFSENRFTHRFGPFIGVIRTLCGWCA